MRNKLLRTSYRFVRITKYNLHKSMKLQGGKGLLRIQGRFISIRSFISIKLYRSNSKDLRPTMNQSAVDISYPKKNCTRYIACVDVGYKRITIMQSIQESRRIQKAIVTLVKSEVPLASPLHRIITDK